MRREFVQVETRVAVKKRCPWAAVICKVEGGYIAFESITEAAIWKHQK